MDVIVSAMGAHPSNEDINEIGCIALRSLTSWDPAIPVAVAARAPAAVCAALTAFPAVSEVSLDCKVTQGPRVVFMRCISSQLVQFGTAALLNVLKRDSSAEATLSHLVSRCNFVSLLLLLCMEHRTDDALTNNLCYLLSTVVNHGARTQQFMYLRCVGLVACLILKFSAYR